jgi:hypothetical protein
MQKLSITVVAFLAFSSAAYAMGGGPYPHLLGQAYRPGASFQSEHDSNTADSDMSGYSAQDPFSNAPHRPHRVGARRTRGAASQAH